MDPFTIWTLVKTFFGGLWSFFSKPPGIYIAMVLAFAGAMWWFGQHEFNRGQAACEAAHKKANAHEVVRQVKVGKAVVAASDARTAPHKAEDVTNKGNVRIIYVHDQALPDASAVCVDPDDADRLRNIK